MSQPFAQVFRVEIDANSTKSIAHDLFSKRPRLERVIMTVEPMIADRSVGAWVSHEEPATDPSGRMEVRCDDVIAVFDRGKVDVINNNDRAMIVNVTVQAVLLPAGDPWDPHPWRNRKNHDRASNDTIGQTDSQAYATWAKWHVRDLAEVRILSAGHMIPLDSETLAAGVGAWTGGQWEIAVEIVCAAVPALCNDYEQICKHVAPFGLGEVIRPNETNKFMVAGLISRDVQ